MKSVIQRILLNILVYYHLVFFWWGQRRQIQLSWYSLEMLKRLHFIFMLYYRKVENI